MPEPGLPAAGGEAATAPNTGSHHRLLVDATGDVVAEVRRADVEARLRSHTFFWLDLAQVGDEELTWLREVFGFHPLAVDDAANFGERPKLDEYDDHLVLVLYGSGATPAEPPGAEPDGSGAEVTRLGALTEVHCFVANDFVVTVHRGACPALHSLATSVRAHQATPSHPFRLFHRVADALVDSFFPVLSELDDRIDTLQGQVVVRPDNQQLGELLDYRGALIALRRVIAPQRDIFASLSSGVAGLDSFDDEARRYFRDVYDHLIRLSDLLDGYRDLLSGTTDAYLSVVSNQLNTVMKQLTIISTVFLPLAFLTGFFGQNFSWMVNRLGGLPVFLGAGIGTEVVAVIGMVILFQRRGWLRSQG